MERAPRMALCAFAIALGCATVPRTRYGVSEVAIEGVNDLDEEALTACLATHERPAFWIQIGPTAELECGEPPFDSRRLRILRIRWPWTEWPLFDSAAFERDLDRVRRWYRARGYYDARITQTILEPTAAGVSDRVPEDRSVCEREGWRQGCAVTVRIFVHEGEPIRVRGVEIRGTEDLPGRLAEGLSHAVLLKPGKRLDEADYDRSKERIVRLLAQSSFARARVEGRVEVDPEQHLADLTFTVHAGPSCTFGEVRLHTQRDIPRAAVLAAAAISRGEPFRQAALEEAQRAIYALGAFSSVEVDPQHARGAEGNVVDVVIRTTSGRLSRFGFGAGIESGAYGQETEQRRWDFHLLAIAEHRNLFGGLRRARLEWRPKLVFDSVLSQWWTDAAAWAFGPGAPPLDPQIGSDVRLELRQPAFVEARTTLVLSSRWDLGPDPLLSTAEAVGRPVFRHDLTASLGPERSFLDGRVQVATKLTANLFAITKDARARAAGIAADYHVTLLEPTVTLDYRDDPRSAHRGWFLRTSTQIAGFVLPSSWDYVRVLGDGRAYVPLALHMVLALRATAASMFVLEADPRLDANSRDLGPTNYRLTGGGSSSNRGYLPGRLGDSAVGGTRRWEGSVELRVPFTTSFGVAVFADAGDVHRGSTFRFDHPHLSAGLSFRYMTFIGPLRFDGGWQVPDAQILGASDPRPQQRVHLGLFEFDGAVNLTIGEAF